MQNLNKLPIELLREASLLPMVERRSADACYPM
jgi:hypothetical protein